MRPTQEMAERDWGVSAMQAMRRWLKRCSARLSPSWQAVLKRNYYANQIRRGSFRAPEPEFEMLPNLISQGDWALDIGANVGHYALRLSDLVGEQGRVLAFEPVPVTFGLLTSNSALASHRNITLINAAASDTVRIAGMTIPKDSDHGPDNLYLARLAGANSDLLVLCLTVDSLALSHRIRLAKIDTEGHELAALRGMKRLLERDHPVLVVEDNDPEVPAFLAQLRYSSEKVAGSSNRIFRADT